MRRCAAGVRPAFTIVELLVVVALMIVLAGLTVAVVNSGAFASQKVISAGDRASGWLLIAKNRALRDGAPRGVRFFLAAAPQNGAQAYQCTEAQYIEAPDIWVPNPDQELNPHGRRIVLSYALNPANATQYDPTNFRVYLVAYDPTQPAASPANQALAGQVGEFEQRVQTAAVAPPGDLLVMPEFGGSYRVTGISRPNDAQRLQLNPTAGTPAELDANLVPRANSLILTLQSTVARLTGSVVPTPPDVSAGHSPAVDGTTPARRHPQGTLTTYKYAIQPAARPLLGEPLLQLAAGTAIDYRAEQTAPPFQAPLSNGTTGYRDWTTPRNPATNPPPNPGPYHPTTTVGVTTVAEVQGGPPAYFDVLFAPSGQVLYNPAGVICMWVRDTERGLPHPRLGTVAAPGDPSVVDDRDRLFAEVGEQTLVTVYTRSGLIATYPVAPPPPAPAAGYDPYQFAKDGTNSGF